MRQLTLRRGFTLVELLVVIGIIALLISILLPALNAARRQAKSVKCMSQLKEIGNCVLQYSIDSRGYYPPAQLIMTTSGEYELPQKTLDNRPILIKQSDGYGVFWFNFLNKYISNSASGIYNNGSKDEAGQVRYNSAIWGCPDWDGYTNATYGYNRVQPGYGYNGYPTFSADTTFGSSPPAKEWAYNKGPVGATADSTNLLWTKTTNSNIAFVRSTIWGKRGAERALVVDSRFWVGEAGPIAANGVIPPSMRDLNAGNDLAGQSYTSFYRHGKPPSIGTGNSFAKDGGKVSYNILYADGHVANAIDMKTNYQALRMKFPG